MEIISSPMDGACVLSSGRFCDERGSFARLFCQTDLTELLAGRCLVQLNHSFTRQRGTVRGLHFQRGSAAETKIVHCLAGSIYDVMVDLRPESATFLRWHGEVLSDQNGRAMYIPEGFAHGFQTLEENCHMAYAHTAEYQPDQEGGLRYDDPRLKISWPLPPVGLSQRDLALAYLDQDYAGISLAATYPVSRKPMN